MGEPRCGVGKYSAWEGQGAAIGARYEATRLVAFFPSSLLPTDYYLVMPALAILTFAAPWWGVALIAGAAGPLLTHLLNRKSGRAMVFPAVRFVQRAAAETARPRRLRDISLLLLRVAALAFIIGAFMQPMWFAAGSPSHEQRRGEDVAILVDRSASMRRSKGGVSLFDRAKRDAAKMLESLDPTRDRAMVVMIDRQPRSLLPEPSANFTQLISLLEAARPRFDRGRLDVALRVALGMHRFKATAADASIDVRGVSPRPLRMEIFTDDQATQTSAAAISHLLRDHPGSKVSLRIHPIGHDVAGNVAVFNPSIVPTLPIAGQPAMLSVHIANFSAKARRVTLTMSVGRELMRGAAGEPMPGATGGLPTSANPQRRSHGRTSRQSRSLPAHSETQHQTIRLAPFASSTATFQTTFAQSGPCVIEIEDRAAGSGEVSGHVSTDNALFADDRTGLWLNVAPARRVVLVTRTDASNPDTAAWYIARAAAPDGGQAAGVDLSIASPHTLNDAAKGTAKPRTLAGTSYGAAVPSVMVIVEAGQLTTGELEGLKRRLDAGSGAIWIIDSTAAVASLQAFADLDKHGSLAPIVPVANHPWQVGPSVSLESGRFKGPIMAAFQGPARSTLLRQRFTRTMRGHLGKSGRLLLDFANGDPALAVQSVGAGGAGRLAVLAADVSPASTDLAKGPVLVPLLHQLIRHLTPGKPRPANPHPGDILSDGVRASQPGLHRLDKESNKGVWVEQDPKESDLRIAKATRGSQPDAATTPNAARETLTLHSTAITLWPYLMLAGLLLLGVETAWLWRCVPRPVQS